MTRAAVGRRAHSRLGAFAFACGAVGCTSASGSNATTTTSTGATVAAEVGPAGGVLVGADGTTVVVPPNALADTVVVTLTPALDAPAPGGLPFASTPWTIGPPTIAFGAPITLIFPVDPTLDAGPLVVVSEADAGSIAYATSASDSTHVTATAPRFTTGAPVAVACPLDCQQSMSATGVHASCAATCLGRVYALTCDGPLTAASCSCTLDGAVEAIAHVDLTDAAAAPQTYSGRCYFPSTSVTTVATTAGDAGGD